MPRQKNKMLKKVCIYLDMEAITEAERKMALETIPKLPSGWMQMKHRWDAQKR